MSYQPVSGIVPQYSNDSNELASGFYLKFYIANTTTPLSMATDSTGGALLVKAKLNPDGLPISNPLDNDTVFIPHVNQDYRLVIYRNEDDADANNTAGAFLNVPSIEPLTGNTITTSTGTQTVAGALDDRVVRATSIADMKTKDAAVGQIIELVAGGRSGTFEVKSGTPPSDPQEGIYVVLENGNYVERQFNGKASVKWFGALGDGVADDGGAIQAAIDIGLQDIYIPEGIYYSSVNVELPHTSSYYRLDTGIKISGAGRKTILTRNDIAPSNFVNTAFIGLSVAPGEGVTSEKGEFHINNTGSPIILTGTSAAAVGADGLSLAQAEAAQEAYFSNYGSNNVLELMRFEDCKRGYYEGQDPSFVGVEDSHASFNTIYKLVALNCSVGITRRASLGSYYNGIRDCHVFQCQIGYDCGNMTFLVTHNANRNYLSNNRVARCQVGYYIRHGDTNTFIACQTEGNAAAPSNNRYSPPLGLPLSESTWSVINLGLKNTFISCVDEAGEKVLYSDDVEAQYIATRYGESTIASGKTIFASNPKLVINDLTTWLSGGQFAILTNRNGEAFPDRPPGPSMNNTLRIDTTTPIRYAADVENTNLYGSFKRFFDLGPVASGATESITLWENLNFSEEAGVNASGFFKIDIVGNCQASNLAHATSFKVLALRNAAKTLTRYYIYDTVIGRATGANVGDSAEPLVPTLTTSGANLICDITAPARVFDRVVVTVEANFSRP